jgi:hypothetical protein
MVDPLEKCIRSSEKSLIGARAVKFARDPGDVKFYDRTPSTYSIPIQVVPELFDPAFEIAEAFGQQKG